jgi:nucleoside 2-deoxyribosyltransferase
MNNPLQRRYQVFVSSTYQDLIEERKHVIQALLETKCVPSGMELFPAASQDQWTLISRVIDDCDYYIVIVAGKYGSRAPDLRSYTEMEFDYAVETGKPVIGFFYEDLDTLAGGKLEKTEEARAKLTAFTAKVKRRLCRPWRTPEGLGSAIKSAMLNEIEFNPRPGWIRADAAPDPDLVVKLKQRILELEQQMTRNGTEKFASGDELLALPLQYREQPADDPTAAVWRWPTRRYVLETTWDEVFRVIAPRLIQPRTRRAVKVILQHFVESYSCERVRAGDAVPKLIAPNIDRDHFDRMLQTYLARGLLKRTAPPTKVRTRDPYWQLAPKGVKRLAELEAVPAATGA